MRSLLILALVSQISTTSLYKVTEKNGLTYEVTSYESDGLCYLFHRPNGETTRWFRDRIRSIERIDLSGAVPSPPAPPEIPREEEGVKVLVLDKDTRIVPGKTCTLYRFGEPDLLPVDAAPDLWNWRASIQTDRMSEDAIEWHKIKCHVTSVDSGTPVLLLRLGDSSKKPEMDQNYAAVKVLGGPCKGKVLFVDKESVRNCHWEVK